MRKLPLLALFALPLMVAGTAALAADKIFPGIMCQPKVSGSAFERDENWGWITNVGNAREWILCPIVRDARAGGTFEYANIIVERGRENVGGMEVDSDVICRILSLTPQAHQIVNNSDEDQLPDRTTPLAGGPVLGDREMQEFAPNVRTGNITSLAKIPSARDGYYFFKCNVPRGGKIISYRIVENE